MAGLLLAVVLAACSAAPAATLTPAPATPVPSAVPANVVSTEAPTAAPTATPLFPVELADDEGGSATIPAEPMKIVSLTPAATETLFELGVGDRIVGKVEDFTPYPEAAAAVPDVARFGSVDVEKIVALGADLVIAGGNDFNPPEAIEQLRDLGVPVLVVYAPDVAGAMNDIELIGRAVGRPDEAAAMKRDPRVRRRRRRDGGPGPRPHVLRARRVAGLFGPTEDSFVTDMIELAGGEPITTGDDRLQPRAGADPRRRPGGHRAGRCELRLDGCRGRGPTRLGRHDGGQERRHPARRRHHRHASRPTAGRRLAALALAIHPDLVLPSAAP